MVDSENEALQEEFKKCGQRRDEYAAKVAQANSLMEKIYTSHRLEMKMIFSEFVQSTTLQSAKVLPWHENWLIETITASVSASTVVKKLRYGRAVPTSVHFLETDLRTGTED